MALDSVDAIPVIDTWRDLAENQKAQGHIPITTAHFDYHRFLEDSVALSELIYAENDQLHDYAEQSGSPYELHSAFAAAPYVSRLFDTLQASFVFSTSLMFGNQSQSPTAIEVDFDNGQGWQSMDPGSALTVSWPDYGEKLLKIRFTYPGNASVISRARLKVINTQESTGASAPEGFNGYNFEPDEEFYITSGRSDNLGAVVQIEYGCGNRGITRPLIFLEGFNPSEFSPDNPRGLDIGDFWVRMNQYTNRFVDQAPNSFDLFDNLAEGGYDIVYVDWDQGAGDIRENAYVAMAVIEEINQRKHDNYSDASTVLWGSSMGGLVGRFALLTMEDENTPHEVSYFITHDTPHLGANVPYAAQQLLDYAYNFSFWGNKILKDEVQPARNVLFSMGTKQMLSYHLDDGGAFASFRQEMNNLGGMPAQTIRNIAIANGNGDADDQGYNAGAQLVDVNLNSFNILQSCTETNGFWSWMAGLGGLLLLRTYFDLDVEMYAMPMWMSLDHTYLRVKIFTMINNVPVLIRSKKFKTKYRLPYDNSQGGTYNLLEFGFDPNDIPCGPPGVQLNHLHFNFIPTHSALNIPWDMNIFPFVLSENYDENDVVANSRTTFDEVHMLDPQAYDPQGVEPPQNEIHERITPSNVDAFEGSIFDVDNSINEITQPSLNTLEDVTFNFGSALNGNDLDITTQRIGEPLLVTSDGSGSHGKLCVNCNDRIGFTHITANPQSNADHFSVHLSGGACAGNNGDITVENGGIVEIGHDAQKTGVLVIRDETSLHIKSGGKVIVRDFSKLVIQDGGELIFDDGAQIELPDYGSVLEIQGRVVVGDNANFTFSGNGRIVFDQSMWQLDGNGDPFIDYNRFWDIGDNCSFNVEGPSSVDLEHALIEVNQPVYMRMADGHNFDEVNIKYGKISLHDGALFYTYCPTTLHYVNIANAYPWSKHGGFRMEHNQGPNSIWKCEIRGGNPGFYANWIGGGAPLTFTDCHFEDNHRGLLFRGGNFELQSCDFINNKDGVYAFDLNGNSSISGCDFSSPAKATPGGLVLKGQEAGSAYIAVNHSSFSDLNTGAALTYLSSRFSCNDFSFNNYPIILVNSHLDIGEEAHNLFAANAYTDISIAGSFNNFPLLMEGGENDFASRGASGGHYIDGQIFNAQPAFDPIAAYYNKMPTYLDNFNQEIMPVNLVQNGSQITVDIDPHNLSSIQTDCQGPVEYPGQSGHYRALAMLGSDGGTVDDGIYSGQLLKAACLDAIEKVSFGESMRRDDSALVNLTNILESTISNADGNTTSMLFTAYQQMTQALGNSVEYEYLEHAQNQEEPVVVSDTVAAVIGIMEDRLLGLDPNDSADHGLIFRYHLDQVHAYRVTGHYDHALSLYDTFDWTFDQEQDLRAGYWQCVCEAEQDYFAGEMEPETFNTAIETCIDESQGYIQKRSLQPPSGNGYVVKKLDDFEKFLHYPLPVDEELKLEIDPGYFGSVDFAVYSPNGRLIDHGQWEWKGNSQLYQAAHLATGQYIMQVRFGNGPVKLFKMIKE